MNALVVNTRYTGIRITDLFVNDKGVQCYAVSCRYYNTLARDLNDCTVIMARADSGSLWFTSVREAYEVALRIDRLVMSRWDGREAVSEAHANALSEWIPVMDMYRNLHDMTERYPNEVSAFSYWWRGEILERLFPQPL